MASAVFRAVCDPTRRQIAKELTSGEMSVGEIAARFTISARSMSRHRNVLKSADLLRLDSAPLSAGRGATWHAKSVRVVCA